MNGFFMSRFESSTLTLLRIGAAVLFMEHGAQKLFGVLGEKAAPLGSMFGVAGILEFFGGLLIFLGLFARPVAFILSGQMAAAYFMAHAPRGFWPIQNTGELAALYSFLFLYLSARGAGPYSVDALIGRPRAASAPRRARAT